MHISNDINKALPWCFCIQYLSYNMVPYNVVSYSMFLSVFFVDDIENTS